MKYVIDFVESATQEQIDNWITASGATSHTSLTESGKIVLVEVTTTPAQNELILSIHEDTDISSILLGAVEVIPNNEGTTSTFTLENEWWKTACSYVVDFDAQESTFTKRGAKSTVYLVDSGVNRAHPDFVNANIQDLFTFNGVSDDVAGHGTAMASVIVGDTLGITASQLKSVKIFDPNTTTMMSDLLRAFSAILTDILANPQSISIVNLSWTIPKNAYIESKILELINAGAVVVVAAGNSGIPIQQVTPASMPEVLTIGAYDQTFKPADFSNYTSDVSNTANATNSGQLDGWAPGTQIGAALTNGTIGSVSGTSISAAIVTACLAYNSDMLYTAMDFTAQTESYLTFFSLSKQNVLDLSDAKYSTSKNVIISFMQSVPPGLSTGNYSMARIAYANYDMHGFLANNMYTTKVELDGDLPAGLSLSNGWIVGRLEEAPETTQTLHYTVKVTFINGAVNTFNLQLFLAKVDTPAGDHPADVELLLCGFEGACTFCDGACFQPDPKVQTCVCQ